MEPKNIRAKFAMTGEDSRIGEVNILVVKRIPIKTNRSPVQFNSYAATSPANWLEVN